MFIEDNELLDPLDPPGFVWGDVGLGLSFHCKVMDSPTDRSRRSSFNRHLVSPEMAFAPWSIRALAFYPASLLLLGSENPRSIKC